MGHRDLSPLMLWVRISIRARCTTLCNKVCQWLVAGRWFSPGSPISSTNKTDHHDITEILLKVALNTIKQTITEIDLFLFFQIVKNFNIKSAFLSNQSFVNVVCRLLNAAKVETNTSFNHRVYWPCLTWKYACTCSW